MVKPSNLYLYTFNDSGHPKALSPSQFILNNLVMRSLSVSVHFIAADGAV